MASTKHSALNYGEIKSHIPSQHRIIVSGANATLKTRLAHAGLAPLIMHIVHIRPYPFLHAVPAKVQTIPSKVSKEEPLY